MEQLRFIAVHEDGQHLVLSSEDGTEVLLAIDERLRSALRTRTATANAPATQLSPRDVQAMIRAGQSADEVAEITGWPAERVARFEGPILAEREHVAGRARAAHVRGRGPDGEIPTLESRVHERLAARGVDANNTGWDATRPEGGTWTIVVTFVAGQRRRAAAWRFEPMDKTVEALDDEARWLSEDEQALPGSAANKAYFGSPGAAEEADLVTSMRERRRSRGRRKKPSPAPSADPAAIPGLADAPEQVLPLEDLPYDPDTMGLPPAAHGAPDAAAEDSDTTEVSSPDAAAADTATAESLDAESLDQGADVDPADGTASYNVELDFDDDYEVDPRPQDATLAEFFGHHVGYQEGGDDLEDDLADDLADDDEDLENDVGEAEDVHGDDHRSENESDRVADGSDDVAATGDPDAAPQVESAGGPDAAEESAASETAATPKRRKDGRPGVPSWDDIMFGAKDRGR